MTAEISELLSTAMTSHCSLIVLFFFSLFLKKKMLRRCLGRPGCLEHVFVPCFLFMCSLTGVFSPLGAMLISQASRLTPEKSEHLNLFKLGKLVLTNE